MEEIWKGIDGYEELYHVSSLGRIKSLSRYVFFNHHITGDRHKKKNKEFIMTPRNCKGYNCISLRKNNKTIQFRICRIVALHFIKNTHNKPHVNHKDGIKTNDAISNLEWVTSAENNRHARENGLINQPYGKDCKNSRTVVCLLTGKVFDTIADFANYKNIDASNISRALNGTYKNNHSVAYASLPTS